MNFRTSITGIVAVLLWISSNLVQAQTTVTYDQRVARYYTTFVGGTAGTFDQGSFQTGMYANGGAKQVAAFRKFRTDASGSGTSDRAMQVGDVLVVRLSATRAFGRIGFSLLASPSATSAWTDRENNYAISINLDGNSGAWGNWYAKYNAGGTSAGSNNVAGQQTTYKDFTFTLTLTAPDRMNATWTDGTTTSNLYDIQLNTSNPITDMCFYLEDDWDGGANRNIYWGLGAAGTQHTLTNNGALSHGQSNGSYTVSGVMTNGLDANSASTNSLNNNLTKVGSGTLTLSGNNTYAGITTVTAGTLQLGAADRISNSSNMVLNGGTFSTGSGAGFNETMGTLSVTANSTIALGTGSHTLTFANSSGVSWTSGTLLTIAGWTGTNNGNSSGTAGKVFFGSTSGGLTGIQLARIRFNISGTLYSAQILASGEVVPTSATPMYFGGSGTWTGSVWSTTDAAPYTTAWTSGRSAIFNIATTTLVGANTNVASIIANENATVTTIGGTIGFGAAGGGVAPIYVASGKVLNFASQAMSTAAGTGQIKNGPGTLQQGGAAWPGGFTLNEGMIAAAGVNAMGGAAGNSLTINGGTIGLTATRDFTGKFPAGITVNADFTLGSSTAPSVGTSNATFSNNTALGSSVTRTITLGGTGLYTWNGIISGTSSNLTLAATAAGTLFLGGANTYGGNTTINGGTLKPTVSGGLPSTTGLSFANTSGANLDLQTTALAPTIVSLSGGGSTGGNILFGAPATPAILTINQSSNTTYSGLITGSGSIVKTNTGTLTLGHTANTYTGTTTITAGELRLNPSTTTGSFASQIVLNGGKLSTTGIAATTILTSSSTLKLDANSSIDLGSNAHDLKFANSSAVTWAGSTLTINGWTGTGGTSGTAGRIFFGNTTGTLTAGQLAKISFTGYPGTPILLGTGELVPSVPGVTYTWNGSQPGGSWTNPANWTPGTSVAGPTASDNVVIPDNTLYTNALAITGNQSCFDFTVNSTPTGNGTYSIGAGASLSVGGTYSYGSSVAATFHCTSTLTLSGTGAITVPAHDFGNLNLAGGARTLTSGATTRICGDYTPGSSTTVGTSTVEFTGTSAQSITAASSFATVNFTGTGGTVTANGNLVVATAMTIASGDTLEQASGTLTISSTTTNVNGTLRNSSASDIVQTGATVTVGATGTYDHDRNGGNVLTATWTAASNCLITGCTSSEPGNLGQSFSDFTWKCMSQSAGRNLSGGLTNVGRDLNITNTNSFNLGLVASAGSLSMTVGRDINISSGFLVGTTGSVSPSISVAGNLNVLGNGGLTLATNGSSTGTATMTVTGTGNISSTSGTALIVGASPTKIATMTFTGLVTKTSSGTVSIGQGTAVSTLVANGGMTISSGTVNVSSGGSGGVLTIGSSATLTVNGGTLIGSATAHTSNINCNGNAVVSSGNMTLGNFAGGQSFFYLADNRSFTLSSPGTVNCAAAGNGNLQIGTISVTNPNASLILNGGDLVLANGGNGTINSYGDLYLNSGTLSRTSGTGTIILRAQGASITTPKLQTITQGTAVVSGTISITFGIVGPSYSLVTLGSDVDFGPGSSTTVSSGSFLDFGNYTYTGLNFTQNSGANLITANVDGINTILTGNIGSLRTTNTRTMNASGQFIYNGTSPQETGTAVVSALYLSIFNTTGVTLSANCTIQTTGQLILNLSGLHGKLSLTNFNLTLSGTASILGASTNDYVVTNGTGRLVMPVSSADVTFPVGATTTTYNPLILNNAGGTADNYGVRVLNSTATPAPNDATKLVERYWVVTEGVAGGNSLAVSAEYNSGEENVNFSAGSVLKIGLYTTLWSTNGATSAGSGPFVVSSSTDFSNVGTFGIGKDDGFLSPTTSYVWNGSISSSWTNPNNWTPNTSIAGPTSTDNVTINIPGTNTLNITGSRSVTDFDLSGTGTFVMAASSDLTINGDFTYSSSATPSFNCTSSLIINSSVSQAIPAFTYGNLDATGGDRVLANGGTIGICGTFTRGAGAYTVTGSTVNYTGSGAQSIAAGTYNNLTISNARGGAAITLPAGTIDVAGTFDPSTASAYTVTVGTNVFNFSSAGAQSIPAFFYYAITNTGNGNRTWASSGTIDINHTFIPGSGTHTVTGSTVRYSSTSASAYSLTSFTSSASPRHYNNLELVGGASTTWDLASGFNLGCSGNFSLTGAGTLSVAVNATANTMSVDGNLALSGTGTIRVSNMATAGIIGTLNVTGNSTLSNGQLIMVGPSSSTTVQGNFTTNDLTISGTGQMILDAASNTAVGTATINGNLLVTSTTANAINLGAGTANAGNTVIVKGDFTKSGTGTLGLSGTYNATAIYNFNGATTQTWSHSGTPMTGGGITVANGSTLQLLTNLVAASSANANPINIAGELDAQGFTISAGSPSNTFALNATGTIRTSNSSGIGGTISGFTPAPSFASGGTFIFTGTSVNTGFSGFSGITLANAYTITWLGTTSLTLDKSMNLNAFNFTNSGLVLLGNFDISIPSSAGALTGSGFGVSKMFVTNGTGSLSRAVLSSGVGLPFTWPIGENTGATEYSPVSVTSIASAGINGTVAFRVVDGTQPNNSPAISYITRYWPTTVTGFNVAYTLSGLTFTYDPGEVVVGPEASLKGNSYSSTISDWTQYPSSSCAAGVLTITSGISGSNMPTNGTYDITARIDVPVYYRTINSGAWQTLGNWEVSSDPTFINPAPSAALQAPNNINSEGIFIRNGHALTTSSTITVDDVTIESGGSMTTTNNSFTVANGVAASDVIINSGGTLEFASASNNSLVINSGAVIQVDGLLKQSSSASPDVNNAGTINIGATGTYEHARNAGIIPTCNWAIGSTCLLSAITNNMPSGLGQSFHHFTVNSTLTASVNCSGALQTINGDFNLTTNHASFGFRLSTGTSFNLTVAGDLTVTNGILDIASGGAGPCIVNVTGTTTMNGSGSKIIKSGAATATWNFNGDYTQNSGTFEFNSGGSSNTTVSFKGDVIWNGSVLRTNGGTHTINFDKATGLQTLTCGATFGAGAVNWNVSGTSNTLRLLSDLALNNSTQTFTVNTGTTMDFQTFFISGGNTTFTTGVSPTLMIGSPAGIVTAPTASGNIRTLVRTVNGTTTYIYTGVANQNSGNLLPSTLTGAGKLTIANTGAVSDNTVTLTNTLPMTTPQLNLTSGLLAIGSGQTLIISSGGTVNATSGDFATGSTGGMVRFSTPLGGTFTGTCNPFSVETNGNPCGVNFGSGTVTIQSGGVFNINAGGFVNTNAPAYASGSSLWYLTSAPYNRGLEWSTTSGKGYPHHVVVGTSTLNPAGAAAVNANVPFQCAGNLTINSGGNIYMDYSGNNMNEDLRVLGNLNLVGQLSGSGSVGSDIFIGGNWTNNGVATTNFFPNGREVTFNGTGAQTIGGSNTTVPAFEYLAVNKASNDLTSNVALTVNQRLQMSSGKLIIGNNNLTIGASGIIDQGGVNSYIVTNGTGTVTQTVNGGDDWFPVGPSTSAYGPVTLNQSGTGETINVRVINVAGIASPSYQNAVNDTTQMVKMEWVMNESVAGANSLRTTFGWQGAGTAGASNIEGSGFDRTSAVYHGNWNGTKYVVRASNSTAGSNPYFSLSTLAQPFTGTMAANQRFVVGNINGILPCLQTSGPGDWNTATNWVDLVVPPTGSAVCISHAMTLAGAPPNPQFITVNGPNGDITISPGVTLTLEPSGTFTNNKVGFNMTTGTVAFQGGTSTINGSQAAGFSNLQLGGNTTLTTTPTINNSLEILPGGFILSATGPNYGPASTLIYNTGGGYNRSNEWNSTSGPGFPTNVLVTGNTSLDISNGSNTARAISGNFQIDNGSSATMSAMTGNLTVPGNFTLNGTYTQSTNIGGDLVLGGNWSSGASAALSSNNRDVRFNSSTSGQSISVSNSLSFGFLTIDNGSTGVTLSTDIRANTFRVNSGRTFNHGSNKIIINTGGNVLIDGTFNANSGTIEYTDGGDFTNNGTFNRGTSTIDFLGTNPGTVVGTVQTNFHNIRLAPSSGIDFGGGALRGKVSGTFQLRAGSYVSGNAPIYEPGSTLMYSGGGTFNRNVEWDPATVQNVEVTNNTILKCGTNGTGFNHQMAGNLTVQLGSTFDMSGPDMTVSTKVGGNVNLLGTLTLSGSAGGDLEVAGDFANNGGTFTCNGRLTTFNGSTNGSISGSTNTNFCLLTVNKTSGNTLTASVPFTASLAGGSIVRVQGGAFDLNGQAITLGGGSNTLRVDAGFTNGQTLKTGGTSIGSFNTYTDNGVTTATLGGRVDYSSAGAETLISPVTTYNQLWITGGATKSITQTTTANGNVNIDPATTLDFGATASVLNAKADISNQGSTIGSGLGKIELNGTSTQNMSGSGTYRNLDINNITDVNSTGIPTISSKLNVLSGKVLQASLNDSIILSSSATLTETFVNPANQHFVRGKIHTTRVVGVAAENFGGMGVALTAGSNLGTVEVTRLSGTSLVSPITLNSGILRSWKVTPSVQPALPDRNITFTWPSQEDNSLDMTTAILFKRTDGTQPFVALTAPTDVTGSDPHSITYSGIPSFSEFTVADLSNPLPLELLSFTGRNENGKGVLNWNTANEKDNLGFEVMKSLDGRVFEQIGFVAAENQSASYRFTDHNLKSGSYYKLIQKDVNGNRSESRVVYISTKGPEMVDMTLYPNPGTRGFSIRVNGFETSDQSLEMSIFSIDGKSILNLEGNLSAVNQKVTNGLSDLPMGVYTIKILVDGTIHHLKWIKQ